jgi:uncharacterized protein YdaU (DUF1376 family)
VNYYQRHIGDYIKDTAHLSLLEHGVYVRLLDVYYSRESGIADAEAARLVGARSEDERAALETVLNEFFVLADGLWTHSRCEREIEQFKAKAEKAASSARKRWHSEGNAKAMPTHSERMANAVPTQCEGNAPINQEPITNNQESASALSARAARPRQTEMPEDFAVTDRVKCWAAEKGYDRLGEHLDAFRRKVAANGYTAVSWDDKFMEAIREDWAKLRGRTSTGAAPPPERSDAAWHDSVAGIRTKGVELGVGDWDQAAAEVGNAPQWPTYRAKVFRAAGHVPARGH